MRACIPAIAAAHADHRQQAVNAGQCLCAHEGSGNCPAFAQFTLHTAAHAGSSPHAHTVPSIAGEVTFTVLPG